MGTLKDFAVVYLSTCEPDVKKGTQYLLATVILQAHEPIDPVSFGNRHTSSA